MIWCAMSFAQHVGQNPLNGRYSDVTSARYTTARLFFFFSFFLFLNKSFVLYFLSHCHSSTTARSTLRHPQ